MYYHVSIRNESCLKVADVLQLRESWGMYISPRIHHKKNCLKVAECIYHHVFIARKVVLKLRNVYIITCSSQGKLVQSCRMYISSSPLHNEIGLQVAECIYHQVFFTRKVISFKVAECIHHQVFIARKDVFKLRSV